jgi:16S rRNA (cytosine1402-N4)-methyltransferase
LSEPTPHRRRPRYSGKYPRRFEEKYKELDPENHPETIAKILASGKTPAGSHVPILVAEILEALDPKPGDLAVDCTLGHGGHAREILRRIAPSGRLLGLDADPIELPKTEAILRAEGFGEDCFMVKKSNFAGLQAALAGESAEVILADLGVSSMQLDNPGRGFTSKHAGPLDMRMNPSRGIPASKWLERIRPDALAEILHENSDEPHADLLAPALAGRSFASTVDFANAIRATLSNRPETELKKAVTRVFQAVRIEVNEEFAALDALLRSLPFCLKPGGRVAILSFHSGEDRRVKKAFQTGLREGVYSEVARDVVRAGSDECRTNPRATSAKLRWACR